VTRKLIEAFDGGERDPDALRRVGVEALAAAARWKERG
jgi:CheY-like chemotaxis protein